MQPAGSSVYAHESVITEPLPPLVAELLLLLLPPPVGAAEDETEAEAGI